MNDRTTTAVSDMEILDQCEACANTLLDIVSDLKRGENIQTKLPKFPMRELSAIMKKRNGIQQKGKQQKVFMGEELHCYLKNMLVSVTPEANEEIPIPSGMGITLKNCTLDGIKYHLENGYKKLCMRKVRLLRASLNYGKWLQLAFTKFKSDKQKISWKKWLYIAAGISDSYARQLRKLASKFYKYPRLRYLPISLDEFWKRRNAIQDMLNTPERDAYWRDRAVPKPVIERQFVSVLPDPVATTSRLSCADVVGVESGNPAAPSPMEIE